MFHHNVCYLIIELLLYLTQYTLFIILLFKIYQENHYVNQLIAFHEQHQRLLMILKDVLVNFYYVIYFNFLASFIEDHQLFSLIYFIELIFSIHERILFVLFMLINLIFYL
jgi:hypothetical protein